MLIPADDPGVDPLRSSRPTLLHNFEEIASRDVYQQAAGALPLSALCRENARSGGCCPDPTYPNSDSRNPAATADPITPATFGPIACIRR